MQCTQVIVEVKNVSGVDVAELYRAAWVVSGGSEELVKNTKQDLRIRVFKDKLIEFAKRAGFEVKESGDKTQLVMCLPNDEFDIYRKVVLYLASMTLAENEQEFEEISRKVVSYLEGPMDPQELWVWASFVLMSYKKSKEVGVKRVISLYLNMRRVLSESRGAGEVYEIFSDTILSKFDDAEYLIVLEGKNKQAEAVFISKFGTVEGRATVNAAEFVKLAKGLGLQIDEFDGLVVIVDNDLFERAASALYIYALAAQKLDKKERKRLWDSIVMLEPVDVRYFARVMRGVSRDNAAEFAWIITQLSEIIY